MGKHRKMWAIETIDGLGREGLDIVLARTADEAREKAKIFHHRCDCREVSCEAILCMTLAEKREPRTGSFYVQRQREKDET